METARPVDQLQLRSSVSVLQENNYRLDEAKRAANESREVLVGLLARCKGAKLPLKGLAIYGSTNFKKSELDPDNWITAPFSTIIDRINNKKAAIEIRPNDYVICGIYSERGTYIVSLAEQGAEQNFHYEVLLDSLQFATPEEVVATQDQIESKTNNK